MTRTFPLAWTLRARLDTPALVVDGTVLTANIRRMADAMAERGTALRPHAKTHKSLDIARLQRAHGARGLTVASIGEAEVFVAGGFDDLCIAYPLIAAGDKKCRLRRLAAMASLAVGVDSVDGGDLLVQAGLADSLTVLVEVDAGQHRSGVPAAQAGSLAIALESRGLRVAGAFTHGGHSYRDPDAPAPAARDEVDALTAAARAMANEGVVAGWWSAGSTPTALSSAREPVTEERPGTYVFNDRQQVALGSCAPTDVALAVAATVVSTTVAGQAVVDAGTKALTADRPPWLDGFGVVPELGGAPLVALSECHGIVDLGGRAPPRVGTQVRVVPNHACPAVNLFDHYDVVVDGVVVARWPVSARGHLR